MDKVELSGIISVDAKQPVLHRIKPGNKSRQGRLARSAPANDPEHGAGFNRKRNIIERRRPLRAVPKRNILELDPPEEFQVPIRLVPRPVEIVDAGMRKRLSLQVLCPVDDLAHMEAQALWPGITRRLRRA